MTCYFDGLISYIYVHYKIKCDIFSNAMKTKMSHQFVDSSLSSSEMEEERSKEKKRKLDCAKEAQNAHTKMCEKALQTKDNVNNLLLKVEKYLDTKKMTRFQSS